MFEGYITVCCQHSCEKNIMLTNYITWRHAKDDIDLPIVTAKDK